MTAEAPKLTKKQKKALAFREHKGKRTARRDDDADELDNAVPVAEDQDVAGDALAEGQGAPRGLEDDGRRRRKEAQKEQRAAGGGELVVGLGKSNSKKRKRGEGDAGAEGGGDVAAADDAGAGAEAPAATKRRRKQPVVAVDADDDEAEASTEAVDMKEKGKQRFILFVGNLKYTTSKEAIQQHFAVCDPPPNVRLLTPKQAKPGATIAKSKGCAFLEFSSKPPLQQALKLHHSELESRKINVELTAGGGGKSETRLTKLKTRNKELAAQREKRLRKEGGVSRPQRFSATSGEADAPSAKRTWTVGDVEDGETHRGGKSAKKRGKRPNARPAKDWSTGVNAIPVG